MSEILKKAVLTPGRKSRPGVSPSQFLCLHGTAQRLKTWERKIHALSGIWTPDHCVQAIRLTRCLTVTYTNTKITFRIKFRVQGKNITETGGHDSRAVKKATFVETYTDTEDQICRSAETTMFIEFCRGLAGLYKEIFSVEIYWKSRIYRDGENAMFVQCCRGPCLQGRECTQRGVIQRERGEQAWEVIHDSH